jgi:hypothetical protein
VHDGVLFVHAYGDRVQALDAATGSGPALAPRTALSRPHAGANHAGSERWPKVSSSPWSPHAPVAQRAQPFGGSANWSIFVAMMKSFSCNPLIFLVRKDTVA